MQFGSQWRSQDLFSSGANVGRVNQAGIEAKRAPRREAPSSREARIEARSAESARSAGSRREAPSETGERGVGRGSVSPSPRKFLKFWMGNGAIWKLLEV